MPQPIRKLAVVGKGGTGKTTIAGSLARVLARRGLRTWAIDADSTPNLALTLGLPRDRAEAVQPLPRTLLEERRDEDGKRTLHLPMSVAELALAHGTDTPDGVTLMLMGRVDHAGAG